VSNYRRRGRDSTNQGWVKEERELTMSTILQTKMTTNVSVWKKTGCCTGSSKDARVTMEGDFTILQRQRERFQTSGVEPAGLDISFGVYSRLSVLPILSNLESEEGAG
jgi:hypothetical protein